MKRITSSSRARGGNRGGSGGGYERTNPDFEDQKLLRLRKDYEAMDPQWRPTFLAGLSRFEQDYCTRKIQNV